MKTGYEEIPRVVHIFKILMLLIAGGMLYCAVELMFRGRTHPSMFLLGGICFVIIGSLNEFFPWQMPLVSQQFVSMIVITVLEFIFGLVLNIALHLQVWDYSNLPYNLYGQICLLFSVCWFFLSLPAIIMDDILRLALYGEEWVGYTWFCAKPPDNIENK